MEKSKGKKSRATVPLMNDFVPNTVKKAAAH
jgi:hypothetical protein